MAFSVETVNRLLASSRNYVSTTVGFIGGIGVMSASQSKGLSDAFSEIFNGLSMVIHGSVNAWGILAVAFPVIGGVMARLASNSATVDNQAKQVQAAVKDTNTPVSTTAKAALLDATAEAVPLAAPIQIKDKELADVVPSDKVIAK